MPESFESMLTGGHPNSLGRTLEVVEAVLADQGQLEALYQCYFSDDEVVRLRTSSALKRVTQSHPDWVAPYIDRLIGEISLIDQASTQWTLATLFSLLRSDMTSQQLSDSLTVMKRNLEQSNDWIVLNTTMQTLADWSNSDRRLARWLKPRLQKLADDNRKSVAKRADKLLQQID